MSEEGYIKKPERAKEDLDKGHQIYTGEKILAFDPSGVFVGSVRPSPSVYKTFKQLRKYYEPNE